MKWRYLDKQRYGWKASLNFESCMNMYIYVYIYTLSPSLCVRHIQDTPAVENLKLQTYGHFTHKCVDWDLSVDNIHKFMTFYRSSTPKVQRWFCQIETVLRAQVDTVYPKKYAHGFVVLCFVMVMQSFILNSHEVFIYIHQGCFAGTGAIVRLPQCQWSKPDGYGKISQCITTTKHSKAKTVCIFLGIYCTFIAQFCIITLKGRSGMELDSVNLSWIP